MSENQDNNINNINNEIEQRKRDFYHLCSWLLTFSPSDLVILSSLFAIIIAKYFNSDEQAVIGNFIQAIGENIDLISSQIELKNACEEKRNSLTNQESIKQAQVTQQKELKRKYHYFEQIIKEINTIKARLNELEK